MVKSTEPLFIDFEVTQSCPDFELTYTVFYKITGDKWFFERLPHFVSFDLTG